jgi:hypothetical protein
MTGALAVTNWIAFAIEGEIEMTWKHTKPGSMNECTVTDERGRFVGQVEGIYGPLIAAAPELLESLKDLRSLLWTEGYADSTPAMAKADALIAKVEAA